VDQLNAEVDIQRAQHLEAGLPTLQRLRNDLLAHLDKRLSLPVAGTEVSGGGGGGGREASMITEVKLRMWDDGTTNSIGAVLDGQS